MQGQDPPAKVTEQGLCWLRLVEEGRQEALSFGRGRTGRDGCVSNHEASVPACSDSSALPFPSGDPPAPQQAGRGYASCQIRWEIFPGRLGDLQGNRGKTLGVGRRTQGRPMAQCSVTLDCADPGPRAGAKMLYTPLLQQSSCRCLVLPQGPAPPHPPPSLFWPLSTAEGLAVCQDQRSRGGGGEGRGGQQSPFPQLR